VWGLIGGGEGEGCGAGKGKGGGMVVRKHDLQPTKENCFSRYPGTTDTQKSTSMATETLCQAQLLETRYRCSWLGLVRGR